MLIGHLEGARHASAKPVGARVGRGEVGVQGDAHGCIFPTLETVRGHKSESGAGMRTFAEIWHPPEAIGSRA